MKNSTFAPFSISGAANRDFRALNGKTPWAFLIRRRRAYSGDSLHERKSCVESESKCQVK